MLDPLCAAQLLPACFNSHNLPLPFRSGTVEIFSLNFIRDTCESSELIEINRQVLSIFL